MSPREFGTNITNTFTSKPYVAPTAADLVFQMEENIDPVVVAAQAAAERAAEAARHAAAVAQAADPDFLFSYDIPSDDDDVSLISGLEEPDQWESVHDFIERVFGANPMEIAMPDSHYQLIDLQDQFEDAADMVDGAWARLQYAEDSESITTEDLNALHHEYNAVHQVYRDAERNLDAFMGLQDEEFHNNITIDTPPTSPQPHHIIIDTPPASPTLSINSCHYCSNPEIYGECLAHFPME
jgi:hypothetical protein